MEGRRITTLRQLELLLEQMEQNRELALGRLRSKEARILSMELWNSYAKLLNAEGVRRTGKEWCKVWNDFKSRVRVKLVEKHKDCRALGGGSHTMVCLTPLEKRVASILCNDSGPFRARVEPPIEIPCDGESSDNLTQKDASSENETLEYETDEIEESDVTLEVPIKFEVSDPLSREACETLVEKSCSRFRKKRLHYMDPETDMKNSNGNEANSNAGTSKRKKNAQPYQYNTAPEDASCNEVPILSRDGAIREEIDEFDTFGRHVGNHLRKLSMVNNLLAQEEIQGTLTKYRMHDLNKFEQQDHC